MSVSGYTRAVVYRTAEHNTSVNCLSSTCRAPNTRISARKAVVLLRWRVPRTLLWSTITARFWAAVTCPRRHDSPGYRAASCWRTTCVIYSWWVDDAPMTYHHGDMIIATLGDFFTYTKLPHLYFHTQSRIHGYHIWSMPFKQRTRASFRMPESPGGKSSGVYECAR